MTVLHEYMGWVITETLIMTHGCLKRKCVKLYRDSEAERRGDYKFHNKPHYFCPSCQVYMPVEVQERLSKIIKLMS